MERAASAQGSGDIAGRGIWRPPAQPQRGSDPALGPWLSLSWASIFSSENKEVELDQRFFKLVSPQIFTPQKKPDIENRMKVEFLGIKPSGDGGADACCSSVPLREPQGTAMDPQGSREHNQPLASHSWRLSLMSLIPNSTCSAILLGVKGLSLVSGFSSQHLMKGIKGPEELLCVTSCPA